MSADGNYPNIDSGMGWHVLSGERLVELLRRAHDGENPDLVYIEEYVNADREEVEGD